jgi:hypothetical protein
LTRFIYLLLFLFAFQPTNVFSEGYTFDDTRQEWDKFAFGFVSGIVAHELGHYVVALSKGYKVSHDGLSIVYPGAVLNNSNHLQLASAGFQSQWLLTEYLLRDKNGKEVKEAPGNFSAGVVCSHLGITVAYLTVLKNNKQGDIAGIANSTGLTNTQVALALAVPGVLDAWRLFGTEVPEWVPHLSLLAKGVGIVRIWTY